MNILTSAEATSFFPDWVLILCLISLLVFVAVLFWALNRQIRKSEKLSDELHLLKKHSGELNLLLEFVADLGKINYISGIYQPYNAAVDPSPPAVYKFALARSEEIAPEERNEYLKNYQNFFAGEIKNFVQNYTLPINGEIKQLCDYAQVVTLPGTDEKKFFLVTMDISELGKQTRELANADTILNAIFDNVPGHIFIKNMSSDFTYLRCNNSFSQLLQMHPSEIVGKNDFDLFDHKLARRIRVSDMQMAANHTIADKRWFFTTPDGKEHAIRFISRPLKRADGTEVIIEFGIDVTKQEHITGKLRKRNKELRLLLAHTTNRAMLLDNTLHLVCATPSMQSLLPNNIPESETLPCCSELCRCSINDPALCPAAAAVATGEMQICKKAKIIAHGLKIKPLLNENDAAVYLVVTTDDQEELIGEMIADA